MTCEEWKRRGTDWTAFKTMTRAERASCGIHYLTCEECRDALPFILAARQQTWTADDHAESLRLSAADRTDPEFLETVRKGALEARIVREAAAADRHYVKLVPDGESFDGREWTPWLNCGKSTLQETALLATSKWMREAGYHAAGAARSELPDVTITVYVSDGKLRHPGGEIMECHGFRIRIGKE
jgi:hypothetical protein